MTASNPRVVPLAAPQVCPGWLAKDIAPHRLFDDMDSRAERMSQPPTIARKGRSN